MRRSLIVIGAIELAVGLTFACSTFSGEDPVPTSDATDEDAGIVSDASPADTVAPDAAPPRCSGFDVDAAFQPPSTICGGLMKNLAGDPNNCGWCGHVCIDSPACTNGVCRPLALVTAPAGLLLARVDDTNVYWVDQGGPATVFRAPIAQASTEDAAAPLTAVDASEPVTPNLYAIAIDDRIYLHTYSNFYQAPLNGGPLTLFTTSSPGTTPTPLAASGAHLFQASPGGTGAFIDFLKADGTVVTQQSGIGGAYDLTVTPDGRYVFVIARAGADGGVVDGSAVTRGALYRYTVATREMSIVATLDPMGAEGSVITADNELVYFAEGLSGSILQFPVEAPPNATPTLLSQGDGRRIQYITSDENRIYWLSSTEPPFYYNWDLLSVDKCGGSERQYARKADGFTFLPRGFSVHGPELYWASGAVIYRVAK